MFTGIISLLSPQSYSLPRSESALLTAVMMSRVWNDHRETAPGSDPSQPLQKTAFAEPLGVCQTHCANSSI